MFWISGIILISFVIQIKSFLLAITINDKYFKYFKYILAQPSS